MKKIIHFNKIASTQDYAKKIADKSCVRTVVLADTQTNGKGRFDRIWNSGAGGLYFSLILKPKRITPESIPVFTFAMALSVLHAIKDITGIKAKLKWPNDVMVFMPAGNGKNIYKKVAGILTESSITCGKINRVIVGVGVNLNNRIPRSIFGLAGNIKEMLGKEISARHTLGHILAIFENYYENLSVRRILQEYKKESLLSGKIVEISYACRKYSGRVIGFTSTGALELKSFDNEKMIFYSGDIDWDRTEK